MSRAALEALARLSRERLSAETIRRSWDLFIREGDRALAITAATWLEDCLEEALKAQMRSLSTSQHKELFRNNGPIATFSSKIKMAYALGIIGPITRDSIDCIRAIRNAFAHSGRPISFITREVVEVCTQLKIADLAYPGETDAKLRYSTATKHVSIMLIEFDRKFLREEHRAVVLP